MQAKAKRFFFHYNKPASLTAGYPKVTLHWEGKCILVDEIRCDVPVQTKARKTQPRLVVQGFAKHVFLSSENKMAVIV